MVKGEFGNRKKVAPTIRRESNVGRGENREEVVLPCANRSLSAVGAVVERRHTLEFDGGLGGLKERNQISGDFIVEAEVSERMRQRRKELSDRAIGSEVGRRGARLKRDIVNVVTVQNNQDIFETKIRGDGKSSCEVRGGPLAVMNGAGSGGVSGKGRLEGLNAGAGARENRHVRNRT